MATYIVGIHWLVPLSIRPSSGVLPHLKYLIEAEARSMGKTIQWESGEGISTRGPTLFLFSKDGREIPSRALEDRKPLPGSVVVKLETGAETPYSMIPVDRVWQTAFGEIRVKESVTYSLNAVNVMASADVVRSIVESLTR